MSQSLSTKQAIQFKSSAKKCLQVYTGLGDVSKRDPIRLCMQLAPQPLALADVKWLDLLRAG